MAVGDPRRLPWTWTEVAPPDVLSGLYLDTGALCDGHRSHLHVGVQKFLGSTGCDDQMAHRDFKKPAVALTQAGQCPHYFLKFFPDVLKGGDEGDPGLLLGCGSRERFLRLPPPGPARPLSAQKQSWMCTAAGTAVSVTCPRSRASVCACKRVCVCGCHLQPLVTYPPSPAPPPCRPLPVCV